MKKKTIARHDDKQHLRFLTVGQTARILGMSPSTLRLWESVGLVTPARSSGRFRLYTPELLEVLKRIKYLHDVKRLNVPGIKEAMAQSLPAKANTDGRKVPATRNWIAAPVCCSAGRTVIWDSWLRAVVTVPGCPTAGIHSWPCSR